MCLVSTALSMAFERETSVARLSAQTLGISAKVKPAKLAATSILRILFRIFDSMSDWA